MAAELSRVGFLLEYVSLLILSGSISAVAITIVLNQMDSLLGEGDVRDGTAHLNYDKLAEPLDASGYACAIGILQSSS